MKILAALARIDIMQGRMLIGIVFAATGESRRCKLCSFRKLGRFRVVPEQVKHKGVHTTVAQYETYDVGIIPL